MEWWLPTDVLDEILLRLPVKSLLRCKAVCRSWCGLIETKTFIKRHYCHESHEERLVFERGDYVDGAGFEEGNNDRLQLPYLGENFLYLLGPVNGILCEVSSRGDLVLVNPATRKVKHVPPFPFEVQSPNQLMFGFGYDASSEDYKIVGFYTRETDVFGVYKSSSDCWKLIDVDDSGVLKLMHEGWWYGNKNIGEFCNGVFYWAVMRHGRYCEGMVGFDMMSEKFREVIQFPNDVALLRDDRINRKGFCRVTVTEKDGCRSKCWRIKVSDSLFPVHLWKDQLVLMIAYLKQEWVVREYYLLHLSSPASSSSSSTPKPKVLRLPFSNKALVSAAYVLPFSYKDSLFAV